MFSVSVWTALLMLQCLPCCNTPSALQCPVCCNTPSVLQHPVCVATPRLRCNVLQCPVSPQLTALQYRVTINHVATLGLSRRVATPRLNPSCCNTQPTMLQYHFDLYRGNFRWSSLKPSLRLSSPFHLFITPSASALPSTFAFRKMLRFLSR